MKETTVQNPDLESLHHEEEEEVHRLSFCDLPMSQHDSGSINQSSITPSAQPDHLFEFFVSQPPASSSDRNGIIFCGKIIHEAERDREVYQKRDCSFAAIKSQSSRKPSFSDYAVAENRCFSASARVSGGPSRPKYSAMDYHAQRVNITALTTMSAKSRRRMFMFGPVKFKPEMELSAIKQRQAKRAPAEKPPQPESGGGKSKWGLMKSSLRGRSNLTSVLARSLGCIPAASGGAERWLA